ncbi:helix-turn-helix transcriptional regulator [Candidatus Bathyarchaeota archaeon]|nr:helix-turn-helix transcriptional regulator [Candidatus Bathyarchaeota archaeon]
MEHFALIPRLGGRSMKRNRTEIYIDVLKTINAGVCKPTNIMYRSNLCWRPLKEILSELEALGLIKKMKVETKNGIRKRSVYMITEKGKNVLKKVNELEREFTNVFSKVIQPIYEKV